MGNSSITAGCRGSNKRSDVAPSHAEEGLNQGSDEAVWTTFEWRIDNFSSLLDRGNGWTTSRMFEISGLRWYLRLNPRDTKSGDEEEHVSIVLALSVASVRPNRVVEATFRFRIYDQLYGKHHQQQPVSHVFEIASRCCRTPCIVPLAALKDRSSGFLVNNTCVFGVELIKVVAAKANHASELLSVQKTNSICNAPQVYTWNIEDFFALKSPSYSPEFELCGHKWFITINPSDENGTYISLFLTMKVPDTLHRNSANLVEFSICIKKLETGDGRPRKGRCEFSKNYPTWGFRRFKTLEDFKDPSIGYLVKTKCCIEAQVAVIGTSKMD
ncbi:hypothetical protein ACQ4PT_052695 [Festuca glaucescens]